MIVALLPILGITFIDILGFSILIPIMPYFVEHFGASDVTVGILFSTFAFCQFIAGPVWGALSDRIGRKAVLIISQIGATIGWTMLAFAPSLPWVFAARIIEGASGGNISVTQAYVADRVAPEKRTQAFAYVGAAFSAGLVLGPAAGGLLLARYGYTTPFLLAAGLQVVTLVATIFFLPEAVAKDGEVAPSATFRDIVRFLGDEQISPVLVQKLALSLGMYAWYATFALIIGRILSFGPSETSFYFAGSGVFSVIFQLGVVGRLTDALGIRRASNLGFASLLVFFCMIPFVHTIWAGVLSIVPFSFGMALVNSTIAALLSNAAPQNVRGAVLGVGSSFESIAGVVMPTIATAVLATYGPPWTAALCGFFCAIGFVLGIAAQRKLLATSE
jgi:DHA1 family tetracycline resistance protein-like MFS transporter